MTPSATESGAPRAWRRVPMAIAPTSVSALRATSSEVFWVGTLSEQLMVSGIVSEGVVWATRACSESGTAPLTEAFFGRRPPMYFDFEAALATDRAKPLKPSLELEYFLISWL